MPEPVTSADRDVEHDIMCLDAGLVRAFDVLGKRWNGVILGTLIRGPAGFSELRRLIAGISDSVLSGRLAELGRVGLVIRSASPDPPGRIVYRLTRKGDALRPALRQITTWAQNNLTT